jgi:hypothetical protein
MGMTLGSSCDWLQRDAVPEALELCDEALDLSFGSRRAK